MYTSLIYFPSLGLEHQVAKYLKLGIENIQECENNFNMNKVLTYMYKQLTPPYE